MMIQKQRINNAVLLTLNLGKATIDEVKPFADHFGELAENNEKNFILDCRSLVWMDYAFLASLVSLLRASISKGGDIRLVRSKYSPVWSMFELNSLSKMFKLYYDIDEAVKSYN